MVRVATVWDFSLCWALLYFKYLVHDIKQLRHVFHWQIAVLLFFVCVCERLLEFQINVTLRFAYLEEISTTGSSIRLALSTDCERRSRTSTCNSTCSRRQPTLSTSSMKNSSTRAWLFCTFIFVLQLGCCTMLYATLWKAHKYVPHYNSLLIPHPFQFACSHCRHRRHQAFLAFLYFRFVSAIAILFCASTLLLRYVLRCFMESTQICSAWQFIVYPSKPGVSVPSRLQEHTISKNIARTEARPRFLSPLASLNFCALQCASSFTKSLQFIVDSSKLGLHRDRTIVPTGCCLGPHQGCTYILCRWEPRISKRTAFRHTLDVRAEVSPSFLYPLASFHFCALQSTSSFTKSAIQHHFRASVHTSLFVWLVGQEIVSLRPSLPASHVCAHQRTRGCVLLLSCAVVINVDYKMLWS